MGTLNLGEGTVACLQVRRERGLRDSGAEGLGQQKGCVKRGGVYMWVVGSLEQQVEGGLPSHLGLAVPSARWHTLLSLPVFSEFADRGARAA